MQLHDILPLPVGKVTLDEHNYYQDIVLKILEYDPGKIDPLDMRYRDEKNNVLDYIDELKPLKEIIETYATEFNKNSYAYEAEKWVVTDSWINVIKKDVIDLPMHNHANSFYSGTYYVKLDPKHPKLHFQRANDVPKEPTMQIARTDYTDYSRPAEPFLDMNEGDMLFWRSELFHGHPPSTEVEEDRISLSFNIMPASVRWAHYGFDIIT